MVNSLRRKVESRDAPSFENPDFDTSCVNLATSKNSKAVEIRRIEEEELAAKVEEMFMGVSSHAVPGHEDILASKILEENCVDCSDEQLAMIRVVFDQSTESTTCDAAFLGQQLKYAPNLESILDTIA